MIENPLLNPIRLKPTYDEKIWGGRRLEQVLGKPLPGSAAIGESLESGGQATVASGPLAGRTLRELVCDFPDALLGERGRRASQPYGDFPLLVKFIDAADVLSLQVHPDDAGAAALNKRGKTEAWYVVEADPGAGLITGLTCTPEPDEVRRAIDDGTFEDLLEHRTVLAGDSLIVPAGTVHAIGAGVMLYEVQQNSDITFRLYDWGRVDSQGQPRALHLDDALLAMRPERRATVTRPLALDDWREMLAACRYFALERWTLDGSRQVDSTRGATFRLLSCIEGSACLSLIGCPGDDVLLDCGQTVLVPAGAPDIALEGRARILCSAIPDLARDVAKPLLAAGHDADDIALLDGMTGDLEAALELGGPLPQPLP